MLVNYFKTALRHLKKNRGFSIINITGLSIGIAVSIVGFLFVGHELSFDRFHQNSDRIVRVTVDALIGNTEIKQLYTPAPIALALYNEYPEVEEVCRIAPAQNVRVTINDQTFRENDVLMVDSTFFQMFSFPLLSGERESVLSQPNSVVLSQKTVDKYFPNEDAIGKLLEYKHYSEDTAYLLTITGIMKNFPENSHFHADLLVSITSFEGIYNNAGWFNNFCRTYILLKEHVDYKSLDAKMPGFVDQYLFDGQYEDRMAESSNKWEWNIQPLHDIHLNSDFRGEFKTNGKKEYVYIFLVVSICILLIACINFVNLSTAKSATRGREVGIRKVLGSGKPRLFRQFLGESFIYSIISLVIGLILVGLILKLIDEVFNIHMVMPYTSNPITIPLLIFGGIVLGVLSGFYPAIVLSNFSPMYAMSDRGMKGKRSPWLRNVLVVFQFGVSVVLIFGTIIMFMQMSLLQNEKLGFEKKNVFVIHNALSLGTSMQAFKNDLLQQAFVENVSISHRLPGYSFNNLGFGAEGFDETFTLNICACDEDFDDLLKLTMISGRFFSKESGTDSAAAVVNEEACRLLGWEDPIGKKIFDRGSDRNVYTIIGVVKNLYYESKHHSIQPMAFLHTDNPIGLASAFISVRIREEGDIPLMIKAANKIWDSHSPELTFEYSLLESDYDQLYTNEQQTRILFIAFSILAIFIACLGLIGLSSFMMELKTRETGIRKVFGASATNITLMFTGKFLKWVVLANIIGWPLAWYFMDSWLQNFQYRVSMPWWVFLLVALITVVIAIITTLFESLKAALSNPIKTLRHQ